MNRAIQMVVIGLVAFPSLAVTARAQEKPGPLEGAWRQVGQRNGGAQEYQGSPDGAEMIDYIVGGRFVWTVAQNGKVLALAGGRYKAEGGKFTETIEYASGGAVVESFVGKSFEFTIELDGDTFTKVGTIRLDGRDFKIDEKWERCKP
ncbi:hypothetical protein [Planctomyces sp. SH-PL62]|uniref:hypothetical protein n=1 Tax=Planctomyces sp. SH-PL62 TaxID=1636152 RepID=UPI00078D6174|nr:hypothetical protein [Planctomyces sp. SH-PL62]AMV40410.1 hypothetical protein VT85_23465 [Planctomyces sp. SH-PL62]